MAHSPTPRCDCRRQQRSCRRKSCQSASAFAVVHALTIHWTPTHTTLPLFTRAQMHPVFALVSQNSDTSVRAAARVTITDGRVVVSSAQSSATALHASRARLLRHTMPWHVANVVATPVDWTMTTTACPDSGTQPRQAAPRRPPTGSPVRRARIASTAAPDVVAGHRQEFNSTSSQGKVVGDCAKRLDPVRRGRGDGS